MSRDPAWIVIEDAIRHGKEPPEAAMRIIYPDAWKAIDARREREANAKLDAAYVDPYGAAVGHFLEYECGRSL